MWKPVHSLIESLRSRNHLSFLHPHVLSRITATRTPSVHNVRQEIIQRNYMQPDLIAYARFAKRLYPLPSGNQNTIVTVDEDVDHDGLYAAYKALPEPRPYHIRPQDINTLLETFLKRRNFVKPNQLDGHFQKSPKKTVRLFEAMMRIRQKYVAQAEDIIQEFQQYDLPLSNSEIAKVLFYYFYKDKKEVVDKVQQAHRLFTNTKSDLQYKEFNKEAMDALLRDTDPELLDIAKINVLLFHASRHNRPELVDYLVALMDDTKCPPNSETLKILLDHFGQHAPDQEQFINWITRAQSCGAPVDVNIVNSIIKGLLNGDQFSLAEDILTQVFILREDKPNALIDEQVRLDKQLSFSDVEDYNALVSEVNDLPIEQRNQFKLYPNSSTFSPFIDFYCNTPGIHNSFSKIWYLMDLMYNVYHLPVRTQDFLQVFARFTAPHNEWGLKEFNFFLDKLLAIEKHQSSLSLYRNYRGSFLKLNGQMHVKVVEAFMKILQTMEEKVPEEYAQSIMDQQEAYFHLLRTSKQFHSRGRKSTKGFIRQQATFVNSNILHDVLMRARAIDLKR